ncbi:MAG: hypothetical protein D6815_03995 [Candidatus Dadabacteria bacterium]|nr:MAG: hypothetical protein D6815_03995 [Candidatus Dadabacteria bacterium]
MIRLGAVLERLLRRRSVQLRVVAAGPLRLWARELRRHTAEWRQEAVDVGVVEGPDQAVDLAATSAALAKAEKLRVRQVEHEVSWLRKGADLVLADVPPVAVEAAAAAGVECVALANFSWDWIYSELGFEQAAAAAARSYQHASLLLEAAPAAPMPAFSRRIQVGLIARPPHTRRYDARASLGIKLAERLVAVVVRPPFGASLRLPPPMVDVRFALAGTPAAAARPDVLRWPAERDLLDLVCAADAVVAKPGYGIIGDVVAAGTRLLYWRESNFPEHRVLVRWLEGRPAARAVERGRLVSGDWGEELVELLCEPRPEPLEPEGTERAAAALAARFD